MASDRPIRLIATDLDGTLLNSQHQLTPRTEDALRRAMARGIQVVLATGKTRGSAAEVIHRLSMNAPGVFLQGLVIYNADGTIHHETVLPPETARKLIAFADREGIAMVAYSGERLLTTVPNAYADRLIHYHEPAPEAVGPLDALVNKLPMHKILLIDEPPRIAQARASLADLIGGNATLVQALDDMLEILPPGASKGAGVKRLLDELGIAPEEMLAIGDAENDIEMLKLAGIGVAVGNAKPAAKAAADYVVASNDEDGVAEAIERFVLNRAED